MKYKYTNRKPISDFLCAGNGNIYSICDRLRDNHVYSSHIQIEDMISQTLRQVIANYRVGLTRLVNHIVRVGTKCMVCIQSVQIGI